MASRQGISTLPGPSLTREQRHAYLTHADAITRALDSHQRVPCVDDQQAYDADPKPRPEALAALQMDCMRCPVLATCRRYAATCPPRLGVLAGVWHDPRNTTVHTTAHTTDAHTDAQPIEVLGETA